MNQKVLQKATYLMLEVVFLSSIVIVAWLRPISHMEWWLLVALFFGVMRMASTISENEIMEWLRQPFTEVVHDSCGAGDSVQPKGEGWKRAIGGLIACPICTSTWSALVLLSIYALLPSVGTMAILVLGAAGAAEILFGAREFLCWGGRKSRVQSGMICPDTKSTEKSLVFPMSFSKEIVERDIFDHGNQEW